MITVCGGIMDGNGGYCFAGGVEIVDDGTIYMREHTPSLHGGR